MLTFISYDVITVPHKEGHSENITKQTVTTLVSKTFVWKRMSLGFLCCYVQTSNDLKHKMCFDGDEN